MKPKRGDVLIWSRANAMYSLVDAVTHAHIASGGTLMQIQAIAARQGGSVWQQRTDFRGRPLGDPTLLFPASKDVESA